ncbi:MAG: hypothetical protein KIS92_24130 [Planctomycetota bacterium]|nr:hypothetical protein [Planctomycetota bacterium]
MRRGRGFTILEVTIAFASQTRQSQRVLWDELAAREYAQSLLEHALADGTLAPTATPGGEPAEIPGAAPDLPELKALRAVATEPASTRLLRVRVEVSWRSPFNDGERRTVEAEGVARRTSPLGSARGRAAASPFWKWSPPPC